MTTLNNKRDGLIAPLGITLSDARRAWRKLDQATLETDFDIEATIPDVAEILQKYTERSEFTRTQLRASLDIAYGPSPSERLDVFPAAAKGAPILLFIHGGGWAKSSKGNINFMAQHFVPMGAHFVSIDYPLAPSAALTEIILSVRRAYEWVIRNAGSFGGDPTRVVVAGNSAGGHLTASVATESWGRRLGDESLAPAAAIAVNGMFDMEPHRLVRHNHILKLDENAAECVSPINFIQDACKRTKFVLAVGGRETPEFVRQTVVFHSALVESGRSADLHFFNDANHFSLIGNIADPKHPLSAIFEAALTHPNGV